MNETLEQIALAYERCRKRAERFEIRAQPADLIMGWDDAVAWVATYKGVEYGMAIEVGRLGRIYSDAIERVKKLMEDAEFCFDYADKEFVERE